MSKPRNLRRESLIFVSAATLMTLKIMLGILLIHRWRVKAAREGRPFFEDDDS